MFAKRQDKCKVGLGLTVEVALTLLQPVREPDYPKNCLIMPTVTHTPLPHSSVTFSAHFQPCILMDCFLHSVALHWAILLLQPGILLVSFCTLGNQALWLCPKTSSCEPQSLLDLGKQHILADFMPTPHLWAPESPSLYVTSQSLAMGTPRNLAGPAPVPEVSLAP